TSCQKLTEVDDKHKLCTFYEKHTATHVAADALGEEWKGLHCPNHGGNDKQGFPIKQGCEKILDSLILLCLVTLQKQPTKKNKEETAECVKLLAKRMKEAKEKYQEETAKRQRLSSLRASRSKSES
ncbi:hypothetical protein GH733_013603, partial [Mirounga leonina]